MTSTSLVARTCCRFCKTKLVDQRGGQCTFVKVNDYLHRFTPITNFVQVFVSFFTSTYRMHSDFLFPLELFFYQGASSLCTFFFFFFFFFFFQERCKKSQSELARQDDESLSHYVIYFASYHHFIYVHYVCIFQTNSPQ